MFIDDYNSDFLAGINEAEMNAMHGEHPSSGETRISTNVSSTSAISGQHSGTVTASASAGSSHTESITIEEEEEDDKENVPMPTRHVRPRRSRSPADIIELTDSDSD
ncbi:hypothetical protein MPER_06871 [Moniliophthora perniciosa FA553]|nr:hypothetical protein MPER_06871 [Moniliophthora perniciosa FA553]